MASHVPFLAVRPDDQFSTDVKERDFANTNGSLLNPSDSIMDAPKAPSHAPRTTPASRLPAFVRFPLICIISLSLSAFLYSLVSDFAGFELAAVSRDYTEEWQVGLLLGWKLTELFTAFYAGYDWQDLAGLAILANVPYYYLLTTFYGIDLYASITALTIDVAAIAVPFALLRPLIHAHEPGNSPNQQVAQDTVTFGYVAVLGAAIHAIVIYSSLYTWLPVYLIRNFEGVRSVERAHSATVPLLLLYFIPMGWAAAQFLFTPAIGSRGNPGLTDPEIFPEKVNFDPETATFVETLAFNLGFEGNFTKRAEVLVKRTAVLIVSAGANTFARTLLTVEGTEPLGAAGWASAWGVAALLTSVTYGFVGNE